MKVIYKMKIIRKLKFKEIKMIFLNLILIRLLSS